MAEEPILNEEWSEENDVSTKSLMDRLRKLKRNFQKRFAEGGILTFVLLFVFGIFFGIAAKAVASRSILMGYWDYTITPQEKAAVNLNAVQQELAVRQEEEAKSQEKNATSPATNDASSTDAPNGDTSAGELPPPPPTPELPASPDAVQQ